MSKREKTPSVGHNSGDIEATHLRAYIERIERLNEEKKALSEDIAEVFAEAKGKGFDTKIMRKVISLRAMDREKRVEQETLVDLYMRALGELADTPLGRSAIERAVA